MTLPIQLLASDSDTEFQQWEASVIDLLLKYPKGTALKLDDNYSFLIILNNLDLFNKDDRIATGGSCETDDWDGEDGISYKQALLAGEVFQRFTAEQVENHEKELIYLYTERNPNVDPSYEVFASLARAMLMRHPVGTALRVPGELDYILVGGLLSCIESQSSIDGICLRYACNWSTMDADLAALRSPVFFQRFSAEEIDAYLSEEDPAVSSVATTHMSALEYEVAVMELLCEHPKGTGLKDARGAIFIINGELMHVADGKGLEDATDCDPEAWGDTDPAPDIEALYRAELVQLFSTAAVIAFEQERCP